MKLAAKTEGHMSGQQLDKAKRLQSDVPPPPPPVQPPPLSIHWLDTKSLPAGGAYPIYHPILHSTHAAATHATQI